MEQMDQATRTKLEALRKIHKDKADSIDWVLQNFGTETNGQIKTRITARPVAKPQAAKTAPRRMYGGKETLRTKVVNLIKRTFPSEPFRVRDLIEIAITEKLLGDRIDHNDVKMRVGNNVLLAAKFGDLEKVETGVYRIKPHEYQTNEQPPVPA